MANAPSITQPSPQNLSTGDDLQLSVSGEGELLTYQWKKDGVNLIGQTSNKLTVDKTCAECNLKQCCGYGNPKYK